ncbi:MAG TPA: efflux RND transporter periplasmic adaptor subunit [Burkholderiaceae bacterium]|nr:efflux RND transporter periplasmic adaptor subunit [Burkholderiaceae bacterium]
MSASRRRAPFHALAASGLAAWMLAAAADEPGQGGPQRVEVATARVAQVAPRSWIPGSVVSRDDARIAGVVGGRVDWVADVGQRVAAGAPVVRLDATSFRLRVVELQAQLARAKAQAELAQIQLQRSRSLTDAKFNSASQLDEARVQSDAAVHDVARLEAQVKEAEYDVTQTEIRAPFAGIVAERLAQRGEYLAVGAPAAHLVRTDAVEAKAMAPLAYAATIKEGQPATVRIGDEREPATIRAVIPVGDDRARQFEIRVALQKPRWPVGSAVEVSVPTGAPRAAVVVPRDAIVIRQSATYVMRVKPDATVERDDVEVGEALGDVVEIRRGLAAGERVVVRGGERLEPGRRITVSEPGAAPAPGVVKVP